jgi:hypothetical protein
LKWKKSLDANGDAVAYLLYLDTDQTFGARIPVSAGSAAGGTALAAMFGAWALVLLRRPGSLRRRVTTALLLIVYWKVESVDSRGGCSESAVRSFTTQ